MLRLLAYRFLRRRRLMRERRYKTLNTIELSRTAMLHNVALLLQQHPSFGIIPVLKSNAYGHGLREVAEILNGADCAFLAVDGYFEAAKIRYITRHRLLVLGYILPENVFLVDTERCSFVVQDIAGLEAFGKLDRPVNVHLELNTGMNRLGLSVKELGPYLETFKQFPNLRLEGVMSHLADADNDTDNSFTERQVEVFDRQVDQIRDAGFEPEIVHIAQTAGSTKARSQYANAVRLGIGLYGLNPLDTKDDRYRELAGLRPVLSLKGTIIKVIDLKPGDTVGYNRTFVAKRAMRIGVLPLGYYEGLPRELSNVGILTAQGRDLPIVGRVSMNHVMVELNNDLGVGDQVTVFSSDPSQPNAVANIASRHHLFTYSLATSLASSIRRSIV